MMLIRKMGLLLLLLFVFALQKLCAAPTKPLKLSSTRTNDSNESATQSSAYIQEIVSQARNADPKVRLDALTRARKALTTSTDPLQLPIDAFIAAGILPVLVIHLLSEDVKLQQVAAATLQNIAAGQPHAVAEAGAVQILLDLLGSSDKVLCKHAVGTLANIIDSVDAPDLLDPYIDHAERLLDSLSKHNDDIHILGPVAYCVSKLSGAIASVVSNRSKLHKFIKVLDILIQQSDIVTVLLSMEALKNVALDIQCTAATHQQIFDSGIIQHLLPLLGHSQLELVEGAMLTLTAITARATSDQRQFLLDCGIVKKLPTLLLYRIKTIDRLVAMFIELMTDGNERQIQSLMGLEFVTAIKQIMHSEDSKAQKEFLRIIRNLAKKGRVEDIQFLSELKEKWLKNVDKKLGAEILSAIVETTDIKLDDIEGNALAKSALDENVVLPSLNPSLFSGLRAPSKGILLFGPPGNGKTMLASSIASRWYGESERLVKALFQMARNAQPSIIFIDEVDSVLSERSSNEQDAAGRRVKTEFLVQMDGCLAASNANDRVLVLAATNRPQDLDEGVLRRFPQRILVDLPNAKGRAQMILRTFERDNIKLGLSTDELGQIAENTANYSFSDLKALCRAAALCPVHSARQENQSLANLTADQLRPVNAADFECALRKVSPSMKEANRQQLIEFAKHFADSSF